MELSFHGQLRTAHWYCCCQGLAVLRGRRYQRQLTESSSDHPLIVVRSSYAEASLNILVEQDEVIV